VPQNQILGASRRANRVGLHETQSIDGLPKRTGSKQRSGNRLPAKVFEHRFSSSVQS
jgi:hypothetical protein